MLLLDLSLPENYIYILSLDSDEKETIPWVFLVYFHSFWKCMKIHIQEIRTSGSKTIRNQITQSTIILDHFMVSKEMLKLYQGEETNDISYLSSRFHWNWVGGSDHIYRICHTHQIKQRHCPLHLDWAIRFPFFIGGGNGVRRSTVLLNHSLESCRNSTKFVKGKQSKARK